MPLPQKFETLICDLGDVLWRWSDSSSETTVSSRTLRAMLSSSTWFDYERGKITESDCYQKLSLEFSVDPSEIRGAFDAAKESLQLNESFASFIRQLKDTSMGTLRVYAMSNVSAPDYEYLRQLPVDWTIFDRVFTSAAAGERKPHLGFYRHVISETGCTPHSTIFIDDKEENVLSARSLGLHGIVFDSEVAVKRALMNLVGNPLLRGREYLRTHAKNLSSVMDSGVELKENFAQLLIFEATGDRHVFFFLIQYLLLC